MTDEDNHLAEAHDGNPDPPEVDVVIEIPRGSFLKRGSTGHIDFISPFPCPFSYGAVPDYLGQEGDLLDVVVLGPRLPLGTRMHLRAWGAVTLRDRGMVDDKLMCSPHPLTMRERRFVLRFFHFYAECKGLLNFFTATPGTQCLRGLVHGHRCHCPRQTEDGIVAGTAGQVLNRRNQINEAVRPRQVFRLKRHSRHSGSGFPKANSRT
jgi:inorganic pyrophosphatase